MAKSTRRVHNRTEGPAQFKTKVVLEALKDQKTLAQLSSDYGIHATQITTWKQQVLEGLPNVFNGHIFVERLWHTVKYKHVYLHAYFDGLTLHRKLTKHFQGYNYQRKHQLLGYQTPAQWYVE